MAENVSAPKLPLSELCKAPGTVDLVVSKLREIAPSDNVGDLINFSDDDGRTALHWAVALKNWALAESLLAGPLRASAESVDSDGATPLLTSCSVDPPQDLFHRLLAASGGPAALTVANQAGNTCLLVASSRGNASMIQCILNASGPYAVECLVHQNGTGQSALHRAVAKGSMDAAEQLLFWSRKVLQKPQQLTFVNLQDKVGDTALHYASAENNQDMGQVLLRNGADRTKRNKKGNEFWEV